MVPPRVYLFDFIIQVSTTIYNLIYKLSHQLLIDIHLNELLIEINLDVQNKTN